MEAMSIENANRGLANFRKNQEIDDACHTYCNTMNVLKEKILNLNIDPTGVHVYLMFFYTTLWFLNSKKELCFSNRYNIFPTKPYYIPFTIKNILEELEKEEFCPPQLLLGIGDEIRTLATTMIQILNLDKVSGDYGIYQKYKARTNYQLTVFDEVIENNFNDVLEKNFVAINNFFLFDGNVFIKSLHGRFFIIHGKNYGKSLIWPLNTKPSLKEFHALIRLVKKNIESDPAKYCQPKHNLLNTDTILNALIDNGHSELKDLLINEDSPKTIASVSRGNVSLDERLPHIDELPYPVPSNVISRIESFLSNNLDFINQLAILIAKISLKKVYPPVIITGNKEACDSFINFIKEIFAIKDNDELFGLFENAKKIKSNEPWAKLIENTYYGMKIVFVDTCKDSVRFLDEDYFSRIKKVIQGKRVKLNDNKIKGLEYSNHSQWMIFIDNEQVLNRYIEYLGDATEIIRLSYTAKENTIENLSLDDKKWIKYILCIYGFRLLALKKKNPQIATAS